MHHANGIQAADNAFTYKTAIKEIAQKHGKIVSFMSKPWVDRSGSCCHYNHSLWSLDGLRNVFYNEEKNGLSDIALYWLGGLLTHARAISALCAPTLNCYRRYSDFSFAPTLISWGYQNRTTAVRVKVNGEGGTYFENLLVVELAIHTLLWRRR